MKLSLRNLISLELVFSVIVLFALSRPWVVATYTEAGFPAVNLSLSANQLDSSANGLALAAIASALGAIATRGIFRRIVGGVIFALGVGLIFTTINLSNNLDQFLGLQFEQAIGREVSGWVSETSNYALLVIPAGFVVAICGLAIAVKSFDAGMSQRYERNLSEDKQLSPWQALDQGIDPTIQSPAGQQLD
jgi:uncharacterized membrane protein (TIGR02234 family)